EFAEFGETNNVIAASIQFRFAHANQQAVGANVVCPAHGHVKAGAEFQQSGDLAAAVQAAGIREQNAVENFQKSGLAGTVSADDAQGLAVFHSERNTLQGVVAGMEWTAEQNFLQAVRGLLI